MAAALAVLAPAAAAAAGTFTLELGAGWNLVPFPRCLPDTAGDAGKCLSAWSYQAGACLFYDPAKPEISDLAALDPGYGYWVDAGESFTWPLFDEVDPILENPRYLPAGESTQVSPSTEPCRGEDETRFAHALTKNMAVMETEVTRKMWAEMWADLKAVQPALPADPPDADYSVGMSNPV